jgi:flagellar basal-body rod protein FlgB
MSFIERMMSGGAAPVLERMLQFTGQRHRLLADNIVNASTPGYRQKDLSLDKFQAMLQRGIDARRDGLVSDPFSEVRWELEHPQRGILFHDGNNRSMEQLMSDHAKNALMHNLAVELLRRQFEQLKLALRERVA